MNIFDMKIDLLIRDIGDRKIEIIFSQIFAFAFVFSVFG